MLNVEDIVFLWQIAIRADDDVCQYMMSQILESPVDLDDFHELPEEAES